MPRTEMACGLVIVPLHLEIGHPAVPLGGFDPGMPQEILDGHQGGIGIEELGGHGVPELVARHFEPCLAGVMLQAFLDAPHRDGFASASAFIHQEDFFDPAGRPHPEILHQGLIGIVAQVHHPIFGALALVDKDLAAPQVQGRQLQPGHLLHPQPAAEHQHDHGPVPLVVDDLEEPAHLFISQMAGQRPGQPQGIAAFHRVDHGHLLFFNEVVVKPPDAVQMAVDRLGLQPPIQQVIEVSQELFMGHCLDGDIHPDHELLQRVHIVLNGMAGVVPSLQEPAVIQDGGGNGHRVLPFR